MGRAHCGGNRLDPLRSALAKLRRRAKANPRPTTAEDIAANSRRKAGEALRVLAAFLSPSLAAMITHALLIGSRECREEIREEAEHLGRHDRGGAVRRLSRPRRSLRTSESHEPAVAALGMKSRSPRRRRAAQSR